MTSDDAPSTEHGSTAAVPPTLPFEYEDRTDGRHRRAFREFLAARSWIERRRAVGLRPS